MNIVPFHETLKAPVTGGLAAPRRVIEASGKFRIETVLRLFKQLFGLYLRVNFLSFGVEITANSFGKIGTFGYNRLVVISRGSNDLSHNKNYLSHLLKKLTIITIRKTLPQRNCVNKTCLRRKWKQCSLKRNEFKIRNRNSKSLENH